jgi:hypothetical protein
MYQPKRRKHTVLWPDWGRLRQVNGRIFEADQESNNGTGNEKLRNMQSSNIIIKEEGMGMVGSITWGYIQNFSLKT